MKRILTYIIVAAITGAFVYTLYYLYMKNQAPEIIYNTEQAYVGSIIKKTVATGSVVPRREIAIKPVVSGIVEEIFVEAGHLVSKNDLIARVKIIPDMVNLNNAENRVERAKINLSNAKIDFDRNEKLYEQKVISYAEFQPFDLTYKNAQIELDAAEDNLQIIREGVSKRSQNTSNNLVKSTISGMILDVPIKVGNQVIEANTFNEGTTIASVADMGEMIFQGKIDESEVGKVKEGMQIELSIGALQDEVLNATLEYISPKGVDENGAIQFEIKAMIHPEDLNRSFIRAGYSANASIVLDRRDDVLILEERLLEYEGDSAYVYVETSPQRFEKRPVILGLSDGINAEVLEGISESDHIRGVPNSREDS